MHKQENSVVRSTARRWNFTLYTMSQKTALLSRVSILTRDIDIANLSVCPSVRDVPVSDENGLTYRHRLFTIR